MGMFSRRGFLGGLFAGLLGKAAAKPVTEPLVPLAPSGRARLTYSTYGTNLRGSTVTTVVYDATGRTVATSDGPWVSYDGSKPDAPPETGGMTRATPDTTPAPQSPAPAAETRLAAEARTRVCPPRRPGGCGA